MTTHDPPRPLYARPIYEEKINPQNLLITLFISTTVSNINRGNQANCRDLRHENVNLNNYLHYFQMFRVCYGQKLNHQQQFVRNMRAGKFFLRMRPALAQQGAASAAALAARRARIMPVRDQPALPNGRKIRPASNSMASARARPIGFISNLFCRL